MRTLSILALSLTLTAASAEEVIKLVSSLPRSGGLRALTQGVVNGIRMAIDDAGGTVELGGVVYTIEYEDMDDASPARGGNWDGNVEKNNATRAVADPDVMAYIGTFNSGAAKQSMPILNSAGLAMVSPGNTTPSLTKPGTGGKEEPSCYRPSGNVTYFRVVPADDIQSAGGADWTKALGITKVFIVHDKEAYGESIARFYRDHVTAMKIEVAGFEGIDTASANFRSLVTKIRASGAGLVYFGATVDTKAPQLAKDLHAAGVKAKLMMPDGCFTESLITGAGAEALEDRALITFGGVPADQMKGTGLKFAEQYRAKFKTEPESYAAYGYESTAVIIDALKRAGKKDRAALIAALAATKDYAGVLGTWSFDANGDTTLRTVSGNVVKNGKFEFAKILGE